MVYCHDVLYCTIQQISLSLSLPLPLLLSHCISPYVAGDVCGGGGGGGVVVIPCVKVL